MIIMFSVVSSSFAMIYPSLMLFSHCRTCLLQCFFRQSLYTVNIQSIQYSGSDQRYSRVRSAAVCLACFSYSFSLTPCISSSAFCLLVSPYLRWYLSSLSFVNPSLSYCLKAIGTVYFFRFFLYSGFSLCWIAFRITSATKDTNIFPSSFSLPG